MMEEQSKDDFLEAALLIFKNAIDELRKRKVNIKELDEKGKMDLLIKTLKEVKGEQEVKVKVIDDLIKNPEKTKALFSKILEGQIKNEKKFIKDVRNQLENIIKNSNESISKDLEQIKEVKIDKVIVKNENLKETNDIDLNKILVGGIAAKHISDNINVLKNNLPDVIKEHLKINTLNDFRVDQDEKFTNLYLENTNKDNPLGIGNLKIQVDNETLQTKFSVNSIDEQYENYFKNIGDNVPFKSLTNGIEQIKENNIESAIEQPFSSNVFETKAEEVRNLFNQLNSNEKVLFNALMDYQIENLDNRFADVSAYKMQDKYEKLEANTAKESVQKVVTLFDKMVHVGLDNEPEGKIHIFTIKEVQNKQLEKDENEVSNTFKNEIETTVKNEIEITTKPAEPQLER